MEFAEYLKWCEQIAQGEYRTAPYDQDDYQNYAKMNWARMDRWMKKGVLSENVREAIIKIQEPQQWIVITEPWCGDAAHTAPFIHLMAELNPKIQLRIELRDSAPHRIDQYLTNGGKSIPKWIVRDEAGEDLWVWGPRPTEAQDLFVRLKDQGIDMDTVKEEIQKWYNQDKGRAFCEEVTQQFKA